MNATALKPHDCREENAGKFLNWIRTRGGLALWNTLNLSDPGQSWTGPVRDGNGNPVSKPHMYAEATPYRTITSTDEVMVHMDHEVKRFHVAIRRGSQGLKLKLTDGSTNRVNAAVAKAGDGAYHLFDYDTQDAIIMVPEPGKSMTLTAWAAAHNL
jgi:hypothetical protein